MQGNKRGIPRLPSSLDYRTEEREGKKIKEESTKRHIEDDRFR